MAKRLETEVSKQIDDWFDHAKRQRQSTESAWAEQLAMYYGRQWGVLNRATGRLTTPSAPSPWTVRAVHNRIRPLVRTAVAKKNRTRPMLAVMPATEEPTDVLSAKFGTKLLEVMWRDMDLTRKRLELDAWSAVCGSGFILTSWDRFAKGGIGEINVEVVSPQEIYPDPSATQLEDCDYIIRQRARSTQWVKDRYPSIANEVAPDVTSAEIDNYLGRISEGGEPYEGARSGQKEDGVLVRECWVKPNKAHPKGWYAVKVNNKIVRYVDEPHLDGLYPLVHFPWEIALGRLWGMSMVRPLMPVQKELNRRISQLIENANATARPKWKAPKGSLDPGVPTDMPGEVLHYAPVGPPPEVVTPPGMPVYVLQTVELLINDMREISGQHEITQGYTPPGVTAGVAINLLKEQDETQLAPTEQIADNAWQKVGQRMLWFAKNLYREERQFRIAGAGQEPTVMAFSGEQLLGCSDVVVQETSSIPKTLAGRQQSAMEKYQAGAWGPPGSGQARMMLLKALPDSTGEEITMATQDAQKEEAMQAMAMQQAQQQQQGQEEDQGVAMAQQMIQQAEQGARQGAIQK
jgi:hypothetical protein